MRTRGAIGRRAPFGRVFSARRVSARALLSFAFLLASLLPLLLFGAAFLPKLSGHVADDISSAGNSYLSAVGTQVGILVFDRPRSVLATVLMLADSAGDAYLDKLLVAFSVPREEYLSLFILDPAGKVLAAQERADSGYAKPGSTYAMRADPVVGDVAFSRPFIQDGRFVLEASLSNPRHSAVGLIDLDVISSRLVLSTRSPRDRAGVVDAAGFFIACSDPSRLMDRRPLVAGPTPSGRLSRVSDQGASYYATSVPIGDSGWKAVYLNSIDEAAAPLRAFLWRLAAIAAAGVASAGAIAIALKRSFSEPLGHLVSRIGMISAGRYEERVDPSPLAEFEEIGVAFNAMAESIQLRDRDIQRDEKRMAQALAEKTLLLKEVYHRVKNNLQIISSLLSMQASASGDDGLAIALRDAQDRVYAMSLVHELVYQMDDLSSIDAAEYASRLVFHAAEAYAVPRDRLALELDPMELALERAIPFGLALNEMLSNAFKYAAPGTVKVSLSAPPRRSDAALLSVADEGPGMRGELLDGRAPTLGISLIRGLADQLHGEVAWRSGSEGRGTIVTLSFAADEPPAKGMEG